MHAIAFICRSSGGPVPNAIVQVLTVNNMGAPDLLAQGITNQDGYVLFNYVPINIQVEVYVSCEGYINFSEIIPLGDENANYNITLVQSFEKPSRDRIIDVKANLCNLYDANDNPIFEPMINFLVLHNPALASSWIMRAKEAGSTHYNLAISCNYRNNPVPGMDLTNDLRAFSYIINWVKSKGLIPIVKLAFDGQRFDPNGLTYGWRWGMDNMERIADGLAEHIKTVLWSTGFDGCFPDWTPQQTIDMIRHMREVLGEEACIDTEFAGPSSETWGYIHLGNGAADWAADKLGLLDHFSLEAQQFPIDITGGLQQIATRLLGPNCLIGPQQPYYLAGLNKVIAIDVYETVATWFYNGGIATPDDAISVATSAKQYGFKAFGNGVPV